MSSTATKPAPRELETAGDPLPLIKAFGALRRLTEMYPAGHPMITQKLDELDEIVQRHVRHGKALGVHMIHGDVFLDPATALCPCGSSPVCTSACGMKSAPKSARAQTRVTPPKSTSP